MNDAALTFRKLSDIVERDIVIFERWQRQSHAPVRIELDVFCPNDRRAIAIQTGDMPND